MMFLLLLYQHGQQQFSAIWKSLSKRLALLTELRQNLAHETVADETLVLEADEIQELVAEAQIVYLESSQQKVLKM